MILHASSYCSSLVTLYLWHMHGLLLAISDSTVGFAVVLRVCSLQTRVGTSLRGYYMVYSTGRSLARLRAASKTAKRLMGTVERGPCHAPESNGHGNGRANGQLC